MTTFRTNRRTKKHYGLHGKRRAIEFTKAQNDFAKHFTKTQNAWADWLTGSATRSREHKALKLKQSQERSALGKKHRQAGSKKHGRRNEGPFVPEF